MNKTIALIFCFLSFSEMAISADWMVHFKVNQNSNRQISGLAPAQLTWDVHSHHHGHHFHFMRMHEKEMHAVIISEDRQHFAHVHPALNDHKKQFSLIANSTATDPDNFQLPKVFDAKGNYFVFGEAMPMAHGEEGTMLMMRHQVEVINAPARDSRTTFSYQDVVTGLSKEFLLNQENGEQSHYRLKLKAQFFDFCSYWLPKFYLSVEKKQEDIFKPAEGFEQWLGMGGHGVLLSYDQLPLKDKIFSHLHAFLPLRQKGQFVFPYHNHQFPLPSGRYHLWFQLNINGQIETFPFDFFLEVPTIDQNQEC